jgi:hypothetical protein
MTPTIKARDTLLAILPRWWRGTIGYRILTTIGVLSDARRDAVVAAVMMRFPGLYTLETLPLIGQHRGIVRGPNESALSYSTTLEQWLVIGKRKGNRYEMLERIQALFSPVVPWVEIIANDGKTMRLNEDGSLTYGSRSWNWDGHPEYRTRFWLVVPNSAVGLVESTVTWDELEAAFATWDVPARLWDFEWNIYPELLRTIEETYRPPHALCDCICIVDDEGTWATVVPDGTWDVIANRDASAYYATGTIHA